MLAAARAKIPGADFRTGDLYRLPVPDRHADLVVCSLALTHIPDLGPTFAEFARVLKPGGHLVTSDSANPQVLVQELPDGDIGSLPNHTHRASDYLAAGLPGPPLRGTVPPNRQMARSVRSGSLVASSEEAINTATLKAPDVAQAWPSGPCQHLQAEPPRGT